MAPLLLFAILNLLSLARAQNRAPHGIVNAKPMALSPSAFDFFNPNDQQPSTKNPCVVSNCSPFPIAATVQSSLAHESRSTIKKCEAGVGAGGVAAIIFGFVFVVLLAMGAYYVVVTRRANMGRTTSVQPDA
ncbi:hypothetical protein LguiA_021146 [Lonicera macranthoides]